MSDSKDTIWLLLGVLLIFGTMAAFSPGSTLGKAFLSVRKNLDGLFGGEPSYCPFINPYAMSIYSSGGLEITGDHPLCGPIMYAMSELPSDDTSFSDFDAIEKDWVLNESNPLTCSNLNAHNGVGGESPNFIYSITLSEDGKNLFVKKKVLSEAASISEASISSDALFARLADIQQADIKNSNKIAIQLLTEKRPTWQCFLVFGLLPFLITFYLLSDILNFVHFSSNTRRLLAIFASLIAVLTGAFANLLVAVSSFVGLSLGHSFLLAMFSLAIVAVFLGQFAMTTGVAKSTFKAVNDMVTSTLVLKQIANVAKDDPNRRS